MRKIFKNKVRKELSKVIKTNNEIVVNKNFETIDKDLMYKLQSKGHKIKEVKSPFGDRKEKLYIFHSTEKQIKEELNVK